MCEKSHIDSINTVIFISNESIKLPKMDFFVSLPLQNIFCVFLHKIGNYFDIFLANISLLLPHSSEFFNYIGSQRIFYDKR